SSRRPIRVCGPRESVVDPRSQVAGRHDLGVLTPREYESFDLDRAAHRDEEIDASVGALLDLLRVVPRPLPDVPRSELIQADPNCDELGSRGRWFVDADRVLQEVSRRKRWWALESLARFARCPDALERKLEDAAPPVFMGKQIPATVDDAQDIWVDGSIAQRI